MSTDGGNPTKIWGKYGSGKISPDGKWVLIQELLSGSTKFSIISATGGPSVKTFNRDPGMGTVKWTADGRGLLYTKTNGGVSNIWQKSLEGGESEQLTDFKNDQFPQIERFAMTRDGKKLAVVRSASTSDVVMIKDLNAK